MSCCLHLSCEVASVVQQCVVSHLHAARDDQCDRTHVCPAARVNAHDCSAYLNEQRYNYKCCANSSSIPKHVFLFGKLLSLIICRACSFCERALTIS